jgi:hypothetical protein
VADARGRESEGSRGVTAYKRYNLTEMDWLRSVLLAARMRTQHFTEPATLPEPQHSLEEHWEPDQVVTSEPRAAGRARSDSTQASTLIVGGNAASFLQCHSNNPSLLSSERGSPADPSFWLTVKEGSPSSFKRQSYEWRQLRHQRPEASSAGSRTSSSCCFA